MQVRILLLWALAIEENELSSIEREIEQILVYLKRPSELHFVNYKPSELQKYFQVLEYFLSCTNIKFNIYRLNNKHYFQFGNKLGFSEKDLRNPYNKDGKLNYSLIDLFLGHLAQLKFNDRNKYFRKNP